MIRRLLLPLLLLAPAGLAAQATGGVAGQVRDSVSGKPVEGARVFADAGQPSGTSDARGAFRLRELPAGWHRVTARFIGYRGLVRDSVLVRSGQTTLLDFVLPPTHVELEPITVTAPVDSLLDPLAVADVQRISSEDLRRLPVSSVGEAIDLSAGNVNGSLRGGRLGQESFILDGLGVKNQLDASTSGVGLRVPPELVTEAGLITNGFSARYGQALSGLVNIVTRDGGDRWTGRAAYETDRPLGDGADLGLDRGVLRAEGPIGPKLRFVGVADAQGRMDADPVSTPAPSDTLDPRQARPWLLPHNSGEQLDVGGKLTIFPTARSTVRLFGLRSAQQNLLFDQAYKYDTDLAPASRTRGDLFSAQMHQEFRGVAADLRLGYYRKEFLRGTSDRPVDYTFGAFTGRTLGIVGEDIAKAQDTVAARAPIAGLARPEESVNTPYGVPAFFMGRGSSGEVAWNRFRELRSQLDFSIGAGPQADLFVGGEFASQQVRTFRRVLGYLPVGGSTPPATAASYNPTLGALYAEGLWRRADLAVTAGLRYDRFDQRADLPGSTGKAQQALSPRFAVSTVLPGATFVASFGQFRQAPDYQYLTDAAFDDTLRTGRFRRGNPDLGYEKSTQYEFSLRVRPTPVTALRVNVYVKRLQGLVASVPLGVNPDSTVFGNADAGTVKGLELILERQFLRGFGARVSYTLQSAEATSTSAFLLRRALTIDPISGDTITPASVEFPLDYDRRHSLTVILTAQTPPTLGPALGGIRPLADVELAAIVRYNSGLPYSRTNATGDTAIGLPNGSRLPATSTVDMLLRRPIRVGGLQGGVYLDVRNLLGRRNIGSVRPETGSPYPDGQRVQDLADQAYTAHPEPIPYESPRYRAWADTDHDGYVDGPDELKPLYLRAAQDFTQPVFAYGPPRLFRLGMEVGF